MKSEQFGPVCSWVRIRYGDIIDRTNTYKKVVSSRNIRDSDAVLTVGGNKLVDSLNHAYEACAENISYAGH